MAAIPTVFAGHTRLRTILAVAENSGVRQRHFVQPFEDVVSHPGIEARNDLYAREVKRMGKEAAACALGNAGLRPGDIDLIIVTSCTGFMIPSLDAYLMNELGFRTSTKRMPISQLGCAAGAGAIGKAHDFVLAYPDANVLIVAAELSSLCFQPFDRTLQAVISALLFGDAVAACVVRGQGGTGFGVESNGIHFLSHTEHFMGFDLKESGFHIILDKGVPAAVSDRIVPAFRQWVAEQGGDIDDMEFFVMHPGGPRVMDEIVQCLDIPQGSLAASRESLAEVGNLSSASIFGVLKRTFTDHRPAEDAAGFLAAFGPGFSVEMNLGRWVEA
jgi:1,3,6,8-tetrahydroxynaphthalene synthase